MITKVADDGRIAASTPCSITREPTPNLQLPTCLGSIYEIKQTD